MQDFTSETGRIADTASAKSTMTTLHMPDEDMYINAAQAVAPDTTDTHALPTPPEGADSVVTDTEQHAALVNPEK